MAQPIRVEPAPDPGTAAEQAGGDHVLRDLAAHRLDHAFALAYHLLGSADEAEEACQDALLAAWQARPRLRDPDRADAWFDRIVANGCIERLRRRRRRPTVELDDAADAGSLDTASGIAERDEIGRALASLSPDHRSVVVLRYRADLTTEEIAERLDLRPGTVRSRLHYALATLRRALTDEPGRNQR